jgi:glutamine synthetase
MADGDANATEAPQLPTIWYNALERFRASDVVRDAFGAGFQDVYYRLKQTERAEFERVVTSLDHAWYAQVA